MGEIKMTLRTAPAAIMLVLLGSASAASAAPVAKAVGAAPAALAAGATMLYSQPFDGTGNGWASQNDTADLGNFVTVYDNFSLGTSSNINSVEFTGEYFNPPSQGPITAWTVTFWSDNAGQPGSSLYSQNISGTGNETFLGNFGDYPTYTYQLAVNFNAAAGTTYWVSVVPDLVFPPQWAWSTGTGGDGISYQDSFGSRSQNPDDLAFTLVGTVPEPSSIAIITASLLSLGVMGRSRRQRRHIPT
jgi:hypothetical protein